MVDGGGCGVRLRRWRIIQSMSEEQQLVGYYQGKIDELYRERLAWLSRFDECAAQLAEKHQLAHSLKAHRDRQAELRTHIYHHDVALLDEQINVVKMQRESLFNEYEDAQQILKLEELAEEFPEEAERHLPCAVVGSSAETIQNELNIHAGKKARPAKPQQSSLFREQNSVLSQEKLRGSKLKYKPTYEELLRRQAAELRANQDREAVLLQEQLAKLERTIQQAKQQEAAELADDRDALALLRQEQHKQEQRHKELAQKYFEARKQGKAEREAALAEQNRLKATLAQLEAKVAEEMRLYEKENKARQTLIVRKSEDFEEDYKARMRAKEHNLQALRDNYEKMQEVCIERVQKLEAALTGAKKKLEETETRREETTAQLRAELNELERREKEQRVERARVDQQAREKVEAEKRRREELRDRADREQQKHKKARLIEEAYRRDGQRPNRPKKDHPAHEDEHSASEEESSMDLSQLENIKQHINKLEHIIRPKKQK